jgi:hypothetical protein
MALHPICGPSVVAMRSIGHSWPIAGGSLDRAGSAVGFYRDRVLPRVTNVLLSDGEHGKVRERVASGLSGVVLEVGFGSGLNVPYYPSGVEHVLAVDPATVGRKLASKRVAEMRATQRSSTRAWTAKPPNPEPSKGGILETMGQSEPPTSGAEDHWDSACKSVASPGSSRVERQRRRATSLTRSIRFRPPRRDTQVTHETHDFIHGGPRPVVAVRPRLRRVERLGRPGMQAVSDHHPTAPSRSSRIRSA